MTTPNTTDNATPNTTCAECMVSYQLHSGKSGNVTGTTPQIFQYAKENKRNWKSYSFFWVMPQNGFSITNDLLPFSANEAKE